MRTNKILLIAVILCLSNFVANAEEVLINEIRYKIVTEDTIATVVKNYDYPHDILVIPDEITYDSIKYRVTSIEDYAFSGHLSLKHIAIPNSVTYIGNRVFENCFSLKTAIIGNGIKSTGEWMFSGCHALENVYLSDGLINIADMTFHDCHSLDSLNIPNSVVNIGESAFSSCGFKEINIPNSVENIGNQAFWSCFSLLKITFPNSIRSIGEDILGGNDNIKSIYVQDKTPLEINESTLSFDPNIYIYATLFVPEGSLADYRNAAIWNNFVNIKEYNTTRINNISARNVKTMPYGISLLYAEGETIVVYTTDGKCVANIDSYTGEEITLDKGVYVLRIGNKTIKVRL